MKFYDRPNLSARQLTLGELRSCYDIVVCAVLLLLFFFGRII